MELTLPVYVEVRKSSGQPLHLCRPLFFAGPLGRDAQLGLAMSKLARELKPLLDGFGKEGTHDRLLPWTFSPSLDTHVLKLDIDLRERLARTKLLFVTFAALGRRIAFTPSLPDLWFEVLPQEALQQRATEVVTRHFREQEKRGKRSGGPPTLPEQLALRGQAWVTSLDLQVNTKLTSTKQRERQLSALFDDARVDGGLELTRVGRCLNWLYPNELNRAVERDTEVERLFRLLDASDNRPLALVGPRLAGKTTVLHEVVRRVARRKRPFAAKQNVWLLSPQRLIAGMMYVGQWEGRVQAILKEARKRKHILYFDDFLGLYHAGISRDAQLSIADMLRPYIHRREVRIVAELTPEAFHALQERDRGLADQFDVLRIEGMGPDATRRVMLSVQRELEAQHHAKFDLAALPTILQLHRSYLRDAAFPGKSAAFSRQLAQKHAQQAITRETVFTEFHQKTGLSLALLDDRQRLSREAVLADLRKKVVSQDEAVDAAADVISIAKARLAAPDRPLATLLFLGPTGVGKTQCARALAEVMFSDPARLLRFDMNEYVTPHAVAQLVGTFAEPDGLLTSAVRRQPFAVVLLDEIEKAHPDVFDLLLQVTGEGRLTDALGRTADFSNAVVVMTSNLGTTASNQQLGLAPEETTRRQTFIRAAEQFFRPEFFNRIDRIVPFNALSRQSMREIAELVLANVFQRDGLVRRRCALAVEPDAMTRIVDAGYHPQFGARALKRAIERQLVQPVAASLAAVKPELPAVISVYPHTGGVRAVVHPLESVPLTDQALFAELDADEQLARIEQFAARAEADVEQRRPTAAAGRGISPDQVHYYAVKEQLHQFRWRLQTVKQTAALHACAQVKPSVAPHRASYSNRLASIGQRSVSERRILREIQAADDIHEFLRDQAGETPMRGSLTEELAVLRREAALLSATLEVGQPHNVLLLIKPLVGTAFARSEAAQQMFTKLLRDEMSFALSWLATDEADRLVAAEVAGPGVWPIAVAESGVHVWCHFHENLQPIAVWALRRDERPAEEQLTAICNDRKHWLEHGASAADCGPDPWPLGSIVRFYDEGGPSLDLRTGSSLAHLPSPAEHRDWILGGLPLPAEMEV